MLKVTTTLEQALRYANKAAKMMSRADCIAVEQIGETFYVVTGAGDDFCIVARVYGTN